MARARPPLALRAWYLFGAGVPDGPREPPGPPRVTPPGSPQILPRGRAPLAELSEKGVPIPNVRRRTDRTEDGCPIGVAFRLSDAYVAQGLEANRTVEVGGA